ncbi:MAG TPA: GDSL-type esterase/lipase family protein [Planctomycetota bacterium]|nr:GDSL-type esterase/lipase family protein [Planctomycetota bacterium]
MRVLLLGILIAGHQPGERIVFLGDSITDGHTLALLVEQALRGPRALNAGVAGDTAQGMLQRLDRDVLSRRPTRVVLSVGINDLFHQVSAEAYARDVTAIAVRLRERGIALLLCTPTILGPKHREAEKKLGDYMAVLRRIGSPVAEVHAALDGARTGPAELLEPDQVHLTFAGYRLMARAVLDGLGHPEREVPRTLALEPLPGIVREWRLRALPDGEWRSLALPQKEAVPHWWMDQERRRGFAVELGTEKRFRATATVDSPSARAVFLYTGAAIESITLNGRPLWKSEGWTGWHAGKERIAARLGAGPNSIEIECGTSFFLSMADDDSG